MRAALTFHSVDSSGSVLSVSADELRSLVASIHASGHEVVDVSRLCGSQEDAKVALTFDDGFTSVFDEALPVLRDAGVTATLFLTTGFLGGDNHWPGQPDWAPRFSLLQWDQVEALHEAGWKIESHSHRHADLRSLGATELEDELGTTDDLIESRLGRRPEIFAYPYGYHGAEVRDRVRARYRWAFTTELSTLDGWEPGSSDPAALPRLDTFYFRAPMQHRRFGSLGFRAYMGARRWLRDLRGQ